ncbi:MAG: hypothetical protein QG594_381, partial [Bacteroidota bacterium]|nr:hypothetical protein [Bacteroidota bacterium]
MVDKLFLSVVEPSAPILGKVGAYIFLSGIVERLRHSGMS